VKDIPAREFIEVFANHLKKLNKFKIPDWAQYVKTGCQKELSPYSQDWLYIRAASIGYQLYMRQKVGVKGLRKHYGTKKRNGTQREHRQLAAGKVIRYCLGQLESAGLVGTAKFESAVDDRTITMGKSLTKKGIMDMDRLVSSHTKKAQK
jgi:small subunit ribosomal protein S19e